MSSIPSWIIASIEAELERARQKFPGNKLLNLALQEEFGELARAQLERHQRQIDIEAIQCIAVLIRIITERDGSVEDYFQPREVS